MKPNETTFTEVLSRVANIKAEVWPSKRDTVDEEGIFSLVRYRPVTQAKYRTPILVVYAFINRPYVLDLQPEISVVQQYLRAGFEVYMIDWGYPGSADEYLDLNDYGDYIDRSINLIKRTHGVPAVTVHGYCLGGTLSAAYTGVFQNNVQNLVLQTTPIDFHTDNLTACWARALDPDKIVDAYRMAPGAFLNLGFLMVDPINLIIGKYEGFLEALDSEKKMANFLVTDRWIFDSPSVPGATFRQYIKEWYQENQLIKGEFQMLGKRVDLRGIRVPLLVLAARFDNIVPPAAQKVIVDMVASRDKHVFEMDKGHVGITISRESHKKYWPRVVRWIEERSEPLPALQPARVRERVAI